MKNGDALVVLWFWCLISVVTFGVSNCTAEAQDAPAVSAPAADVPLSIPDVQLPSTGEILALDAGERAPHDGMLIDDADLVAWRQMIERLTFQLAALRELDARTLALRLDEERARTRAADERTALRDELWRARAQELSASLATAQGRQGPAWYEQPLLWVVIGAVLGGALVGLIAHAI